MHELFSQVLTERDLSRAGDLFSLDDNNIVEDLSQVLAKIQEIASASDFIRNDNDQSVVEISITRVTSAIRDTGTIEKHGPALVSLLESCLNHDLRPSPKDEDPPHAKITSDVVSCIFLNHNRKSVMKLALPISVKFLHRGNKELSRNLSSYLSLAAINNAELLAPHIQPIIDSIIGGNYSLARVLPQIYAVNKHPIHDHVMALVSLLPQCEDPEKLSLLSLFGLIAKHKPSLLESNLPQLSECLTIANTAASALQIFLDCMTAARPQLFTEHIQKIKGAADLQPNSIPLVARILGIVGKLSIEKGRDSLDFLIGQIAKVEHSTLHGVLREIRSITETFPPLLPEVFPKISSQLESLASSTARMHLQRLRAELNASRISQQMINNSKGGVTIVKVGGSKNDISTSSNLPINAITHSPPSSTTSLSLPGNNHSTSGKVSAIPLRDSRVNLNLSRSHLMTHQDSRSLGSLHAVNRSMGRLPLTGPLPTSHQNISRLSGSPGITASMTRIHHHSGSSAMNRSMTAIANSRQNLLLINHNQPVPTSVSSHFNSHSAAKICSGGVTVTTSASHKSIAGSVLALQDISPSVVMVSINGTTATGESSLSSSSSPPFLHHNHHHHHHHHHHNAIQPITLSPLVVGAISGSVPTSSSPSHSSQPLSSASMQEISTAESQRDSFGGMNTSLSSPATTPPRLRIHNNNNTNKNSTRITMNSDGANSNTQRISVFEPYPMRDAIQHFCEKHLDKIKAYMLNVFAKIPLPVKICVEERKSKKHAKLHFACQGKGEHCLYNKQRVFTMKTRNPRIWIHLMFLALQARATSALSTRESSVSSLKNCWDTLKADVRSFLTLVTSAFPSAKDQDNLIAELRNSRFFDVFEYNAPVAIWGCFLCNHPDKAQGFLQANAPVIEGQLKEKKGKWKLFKRWRTRYFTLSGAHLSYRGSDEKDTQPIEVSQIRSVRAISSRGRNIPKAFEIFTHDKTFVLKAKDSKNLEQWVQCISIAMAHSHAKEVVVAH